MYEIVLFIHSWFRWLLLLILIFIIFRAVIGVSRNTIFMNFDDRLSLILVSLFHLQLVLGLILYFFLSPMTRIVFSDFGSAMKNETLRYWGIEHVFVMILTVIIVQIGRIMIKRSKTDKAKFKNELIYFMMAFLLMISRIPWLEPVRMMRGIIE